MPVGGSTYTFQANQQGGGSGLNCAEAVWHVSFLETRAGYI